MVSAQPAQPEEPLVVKLIFEDLGRGAYGYQADDGTPVVHVDRRALNNDPVARATAFSVLVKQARVATDEN